VNKSEIRKKLLKARKLNKNKNLVIKYFKDLSLLEYIDADRDLKTISSDIKQKMA